MLLEQPKHSDIIFLIVTENVFSIFSAEFILMLRDISIIKLQISITLHFAVMDYKVQGATFQIAMLNLHKSLT